MKALVKANTNLIRNVLILTYVLIVLAFSATAKAQMSVMPVLTNENQIETNIFEGEVAMTVDRKFYLIVSENFYFELFANIDLAEFAGAAVVVEGVELNHQVGPVFELSAADPLRGGMNKPVAAPGLVVLGISEVTE